MNWLKRITTVAIGVLLIAVLIGAAAFAQDDGNTETPEAESGEPASEASADEASVDEVSVDDETETTGPGRWRHRILDRQKAFLAEALGISVEALQEAYEEARIAAIEQAVEEGLLTEEQADDLLDGDNGFRGHIGRIFALSAIDGEALLADALEISVEELQDARTEALATHLEAMVEAGLLTQEEADLIIARRAVGEYVDQEALTEMIQEAYESAVAQALEDGAITQEQADELLENLAIPERFDFFGRGFPGRGPRGHHGFRGGPGVEFFGNSNGASHTDAPADA